MEWISIKDRLPQLGQEVLVYAKTSIRFRNGFQIAQTRIKLATSNSSEFIIPIQGGYRARWDYFPGIRTGTITHWMVLPNPPQS